VAKECGTDGAGEEGDAEGGERCQCRGGRIGCREEESWEDKYRCRGIDVEVEELDGSPDQTSEEDLARRIDVL